MSTDESLVERFEADVFHPESWRYRVQTMLLFGGTLCVGVFFGLRWAAIDTINHFLRTQPPLQASQTIAALTPLWNSSMRIALALSFVGLVGGVGLWAVEDNESEADRGQTNPQRFEVVIPVVFGVVAIVGYRVAEQLAASVPNPAGVETFCAGCGMWGPETLAVVLAAVPLGFLLLISWSCRGRKRSEAE